MKMNGKTGFAFLLIGLGILIMLSKFGISVGGIMGFVFPILMMALGYVGIKNGRSTIGWILMIIGTIMLLGKLSGIITILIAGGLIVYGVSVLRRDTV